LYKVPGEEKIKKMSENVEIFMLFKRNNFLRYNIDKILSNFHSILSTHHIKMDNTAWTYSYIMISCCLYSLAPDAVQADKKNLDPEPTICEEQTIKMKCYQ